jgi:intracellular sulfur oxidation DsrE/DsrF family protein
MNHRTLLSVFAGLTLALIAAGSNAQTTPAVASKPAKLVIQVSDAEPAKWHLALNNAKNVQDELGAKNVEIEIVAYGPGIGMLKLDAVTNSRVSDLAKSGIKVVACENTMRNQKLSLADMHPASSFAPSGVVQLMTRQSQGWAYVRP